MTRSFNDFRNRRQRATLTHGLRVPVAPLSVEAERRGRFFAISAAALLILGMTLRVAAIVQGSQAIHGMTFKDMGNTEAVTDALNQVTVAVATASDWLLFAGVLTLVGFAFAWTAFVKKRYRASWSFPTFIVLAILHLPLLPIGTLLSIISLWHLFLRRHEFSPPKPVIPVSP